MEGGASLCLWPKLLDISPRHLCTQAQLKLIEEVAHKEHSAVSKNPRLCNVQTASHVLQGRAQLGVYWWPAWNREPGAR